MSSTSEPIDSTDSGSDTEYIPDTPSEGSNSESETSFANGVEECENTVSVLIYGDICLGLKKQFIVGIFGKSLQ